MTRDCNGRFITGNTAAKAKRGFKDRGRQLARLFNDTDINLVHNMLMSKVAEGDTAAMALVSRYIAPPPKATLGPTPFDYCQEDPLKAAESIICAVSNGQLPADVGRILLDGMTGVQRIREAVELEERLKAIEEKLGQEA